MRNKTTKVIRSYKRVMFMKAFILNACVAFTEEVVALLFKNVVQASHEYFTH